MLAWRLCKTEHVTCALDGMGAEKYGGRWNHRGDKVVYMSSTLSLATLELLVHLDPNCIPIDFRSIRIVIPENVSCERITTATLPKRWRDYPAPIDLQEVGSRWLHERRSLVLVVPSAVNPEEDNLLLNPLHPEITNIMDVDAKPFHFDPRLRE